MERLDSETLCGESFLLELKSSERGCTGSKQQAYRGPLMLWGCKTEKSEVEKLANC